MMKSGIPVITQAIKGAAKVAQPHLKSAVKDIVTAGSKRVIDKLANDIVHKVHQQKRSSKRRRKWQNL